MPSETVTMAATATLPPTIPAVRRQRSKLRWSYDRVLARPSVSAATYRSKRSSDISSFLSVLSDASSMNTNGTQLTTASEDTATPYEDNDISMVAVVESSSAAPPRRRASDALDEAALQRIGRVAKKKVEALAQRPALIGRWRKRKLRVASTTECQVLDLQSSRRDEYKIVARFNISSSLRDIMNAFSTDNTADFHKCMSALFGSVYILGRNVHSVETSGERPSRRSSVALSTRRRVSLLSRRDSSQYERPTTLSTAFSTIKMAVNSATLLLRNRVRRRLCEWQFLEYLEENIDAMAVTRVLQTITTGRSPRQRASPLGDLLVGYVIREDPDAQFTRIFFYAEANPATNSGDLRVSRQAIRLVRRMADTLCGLVAMVDRQRLSTYYRLYQVSDSMPIAASRCCVCDASVGVATRSRPCACCRQLACRRCLERREVLTDSNAIKSQRIDVCLRCTERASTLPSLLTSYPASSDAIL